MLANAYSLNRDSLIQRSARTGVQKQKEVALVVLGSKATCLATLFGED